jgi:hypothetical protein
MKKLIFTLLFTLSVSGVYSQEIYFLTGKNYTTYQLRYQGAETVNQLDKKGSGSSYEIGLALPIKVQRLAFDNNLDYIVGLNLNQFNASAGNQNNHYSWDADYIGITNALKFSFVQTDHVDIAVKGGFTTATLISGSQKINNSKFDLHNQKDFNGIIVSPLLGLQAICNLSEYGYLSLGYNYSRSFSLTNTTEKKVSFLNHQILFGISFELY